MNGGNHDTQIAGLHQRPTEAEDELRGAGRRRPAAALAQAVAVAGLPLPLEPVKRFVRCEQGPNVRLLPDGHVWHRVGEP